MSKTDDCAASIRLLLPHPDQWTAAERVEARMCSGYCTARYKAGDRLVDVPRPCAFHSPDWRCDCGDLNRAHEAFCYRCGAGSPDDA